MTPKVETADEAFDLLDKMIAEKKIGWYNIAGRDSNSLSLVIYAELPRDGDLMTWGNTLAEAVNRGLTPFLDGKRGLLKPGEEDV